ATIPFTSRVFESASYFFNNSSCSSADIELSASLLLESTSSSSTYSLCFCTSLYFDKFFSSFLFYCVGFVFFFFFIFLIFIFYHFIFLFLFFHIIIYLLH